MAAEDVAKEKNEEQNCRGGGSKRRRRGRGQKSTMPKSSIVVKADVKKEEEPLTEPVEEVTKIEVSEIPVQTKRGGRKNSSKIVNVSDPSKKELPVETEKPGVDVTEEPTLSDQIQRGRRTRRSNRFRNFDSILTHVRRNLSVVIEEPEDLPIEEEREKPIEKEAIVEMTEIIETNQKLSKKKGGRGSGSSAEKHQKEKFVRTVRRKRSIKKYKPQECLKRLGRKNKSVNNTPKYMEISCGEKLEEFFKMKIVRHPIENEHTMIMKNGKRADGQTTNGKNIRKVYVKFRAQSNFVKLCTQVSKLLS